MPSQTALRSRYVDDVFVFCDRQRDVLGKEYIGVDGADPLNDIIERHVVSDAVRRWLSIASSGSCIISISPNRPSVRPSVRLPIPPPCLRRRKDLTAHIPGADVAA